MQACDIELMLQEAIHKRFPGEITRAPGVQFLHDNGPEYIEKTFRKRLISWEMENCNTPTYSPESNGMCEAFNNTFKRDYVFQNCLDNFETLKSQIADWVHDYNTYAPHSALGMKTPKEYFNLKKAA
jgi:putative transposase